MTPTHPTSDPIWNRWLAELTERHRRNLTFAELRKGVQALSDVYVHRKAGITGRALSGAGKRAAFASFYAPLHYLLGHEILNALRASTPQEILDLGCGTGTVGAAWARRGSPPASVLGVELQSWAAQEARLTYSALGVPGRVKVGDLLRERLGAWANRGAASKGVVLAFTVNELTDSGRERLLRELQAAVTAGLCVLVVEPIAKRPVPWWPQWQSALGSCGAREDTWKIPVSLPPPLAEMDRAARLDHSVLKARSLWAPGAAP